MGSEKRQRQRENRMRAIAEAERAKKRSTTGRKVFRVALIVVVVLGALFLWSVFSGDDGEEIIAAGAEPAAVESEEPNDEGEESNDEDPAEASDEAGQNEAAEIEAEPEAPECPATDGSDGPRSQFDAPHAICIDPETLYAATFETSLGDFTMVLDPRLDLDSVNNFVVLARWGAFDDTLFHRVISDFVIQGGDVQNQFGTGGPGYQFTGAFPPQDWYRIGSVAMANRGSPATNTSQFFVITGPNGAALPALYSPLGHVVAGMDTVMEIEGVETEPGDAPVDDVVVIRATVTEATQEQIDAYADARS